MMKNVFRVMVLLLMDNSLIFINRLTAPIEISIGEADSVFNAE